MGLNDTLGSASVCLMTRSSCCLHRCALAFQLSVQTSFHYWCRLLCLPRWWYNCLWQGALGRMRFHSVLALGDTRVALLACGVDRVGLQACLDLFSSRQPRAAHASSRFCRLASVDFLALPPAVSMIVLWFCSATHFCCFCSGRWYPRRIHCCCCFADG